MSAVNPLPASGAAADKRPYEPSMEEILASIRRIIADDQTLPGKALLGEAETPAALDQPVTTPPHDEATIPLPAQHVVPATSPPGPQVQPPSAPEVIRQAPISDLRAYGHAHGVVAAPQFAAPDGPSGYVEPETAMLHEMRQAAPEAPAESAPLPQSDVFDEDDETLYEEAIEPEPLPLHIDDDVTSPAAEPAALFSSATDTSITSAFNMLAASRLADNSDELMNLAREMIRPLLRSWIDDNLPSMVERLVRAEIERVARGGR